MSLSSIDADVPRDSLGLWWLGQAGFACHFGMFAEHGAADPAGFLHACRYFCPEVHALVLKPGERFLCNRK